MLLLLPSLANLEVSEMDNQVSHPSLQAHQTVIVLIYHTKIDTKSVLYLILPAINDFTIIEIPRLAPMSPPFIPALSLHAMESLRWRRNSFLLPLLMPVALVLLGGVVTTEVVTGFGYLESLTPSLLPSVVTAAKEESAILLSTKTTTTTNYLDSLQLRHNNPDVGVVAAATTTATSPTTTDATIASTDDWAAETIAEIPDDHYSKFHPGAGWAGYQHPMYGGYLDNLAISSSSSSSTENNSSSSNNNSSNDNNDGTAAAAATQDASSTTTSASCVLEVGKKADYGDDIRWGAQVYLDHLK